MRLFYRLTVILILCIPAVVWCQDTTEVTASVNSDTVGVQDQLQFTVTVSGKDSQAAGNPRIPNLKGFKIVSGPNLSTQFQWINGRTSSSKSFAYVLIPEKEGQFTIDPVEVRIGNRVYKTQQVQVRVTSASHNPPPPPPRLPDFPDLFEDERTRTKLDAETVFVRADLDRRAVYPGQQATLSYTLYTQVRITGIQLKDSPALAGFWVEDLEIEKLPKEERQVINGREYQTVTIKKQALFATSTGKLKIPSSTFAISAAVGSGGLLGAFSRDETLFRKTQELYVDVKPLPATGRPPDFGNAVGIFKLTADIDKNQVAAGDAVALHVKLEGQGNLKMIPDIALPQIPDFTIYSSKRADTARFFPKDQIGGDKTWEYVIVPKTAGSQSIPSISFSSFNPDRETYETVKTPVLNLNVTRGGDASTALSGLSGSDKQDLVRRGTDISFVKRSPGNLEKSVSPFHFDVWFYLLAAIPIAFNAGILIYQRQRSRLADNGVTRNRKAKRKALGQLRIAEKEGRSDARRFYDRAAAALAGYLADRFDMKEIELTGDNLERTLSANRVRQEVVEETRACLQECDFGRFVQASGSADKMQALSARIRGNIDALGNTNSARGPLGASARQNREGVFWKFLILCFLLWPSANCLCGVPAQTQAEQLFAGGNLEYQKGNFKAAETFYRQILASGMESGPVYYNLGNACFRQMRMGEAIYYWEKAKQRMPADQETRANLELANLLLVDRIEAPADPLPMRILAWAGELFTITRWSRVALLLFALLNISFSIYLLTKNARIASFAFGGCFALGLVFLLSAGLWSWKLYESAYRKEGIVVGQKVDIRSGPGMENIAVFTIHEGIKVRVRESSSGWYQIILPNGWSGWLPQQYLRIL